MSVLEKRVSRATGFELLQSKLAIPALRPGVVRRDALLSRLAARAAQHVVSLSAPAGYGKTTLLAQWAAEDTRPFAWVSLDDRDNDPAVFLTYVAAAADAIQAVDARVFRAAASGASSMWTIGLPRLGAALGEMRKPIVLVLDDVHELQDRDCLDALEPIAAHLPHGSQLVLSGRSEDGLPLARLRGKGRLLTIGSAELALSDAEATELLAASGVRVTDAHAASLNARTEGWPVAILLAALFAQEAGADALSSFAGDDRFVTDYLRSEHLSKLKRSEVQFLTRTSILDRMSASSCDELLERNDSARRLESLERRNAFVVPLDHHREWYRYHHLFRDMLRAELHRLEPELVPTLHRRAASWCERRGLADAAIEHAAAAGELDEVARLVGAYALSYYRSGRVGTVERWFGRFDDPELLAAHPEIAGFAAFISALRGRPDEAERYSWALEHTEHDGPMLDGSPSAAPWAALVRALLCRHGIEEMGADARLALDELPASSFWHPIGVAILGISLLFEGETESARRVLEEAAEESAGTGAIYAGVIARSELAILAIDAEDGETAEAQLAAARSLLDHQPIDEYVASAIYLAASARFALTRRQSASARDLVVRATRLRPQLTQALPWFAVQVSLELSRSHLSLGDIEGARTLFREASDVLHTRPELGTLRAEARELGDRLARAASVDDGWASSLTAAELRLLPLLTTHLSFREIAERLYVSRNTVKTQAIAVYRKLGASSRSEAIERALELGLVDAPSAAGRIFTPAG
ncbi:MAG TPA: LuxR C-terminal-related transcriptional regulator [Gaiellaceae bacterium]|nr:LuxR C-terminal-related transcriptional regulator [Gaiellaceae bacterium]